MNDDFESIKNLLYQIGNEIANEAKIIAPYDTGNLKADIQVFDDEIEDGVISIGNTKLAFYAPYVHEGTGKRARNPKKTNGKIKKGGIKPQPYLEDASANYIRSGGLDRALDMAGDNISDEIVANLNKSLKDIKIC